jgi:hypothetical protein
MIKYTIRNMEKITKFLKEAKNLVFHQIFKETQPIKSSNEGIHLLQLSIEETQPIQPSIEETELLQTSIIDQQSLPLQVVDKTDALFIRDSYDHTKLTNKLNPDFQTLIVSGSKTVTSVKTDGTCGALINIDGEIKLYRRQEIKHKSLNFEHVLTTGKLTEIVGLPCWVANMERDCGHGRKVTSPLYIFQLTDGRPKRTSMVGFTPVSSEVPEDKYVITAIETDPITHVKYIYTTQSVPGSLDIPIIKIPVNDLTQGKQMMTVEIMGRKISNKYGFDESFGDKCFVNPHGSIIIPDEELPELTYDANKSWFSNDQTNRWANQEGFVIHFPSENVRFKLHRGHVDMLKSWEKKKSCGITFLFDKL